METAAMWVSASALVSVRTIMQLHVWLLRMRAVGLRRGFGGGREWRVFGKAGRAPRLPPRRPGPAAEPAACAGAAAARLRGRGGRGGERGRSAHRTEHLETRGGRKQLPALCHSLTRPKEGESPESPKSFASGLLVAGIPFAVDGRGE